MESLFKLEEIESNLKSRGYKNPKTMNGYYLDELVSALQKAIRRGQEDKALFWMSEMIESGFIKYFWRRISIIAVEDIGLADPHAPVLINSLYQLNKEFIRKKRNEVLQPTMAILYLCRCKKNREVDHALDYIGLKKEQGYAPPIPPEALDKHTERGRQELKSQNQCYEEKAMEKFFYEGIKLKNRIKIQNDKYLMKICQIRNINYKAVIEE